MRCPKCKYVSFEYLENCKICGNDLTEHKVAHGIDLPIYSSLGIPAYIAKNSATAENRSIDSVGDIAVEEGSDIPGIIGEAFQEVASAEFDADGVPVAKDENSDAVEIAKEVGNINISGEDETDEPQEEISLVEEEEKKEIVFGGLGEEESEEAVAETEESDDSTKEFSLDEIGGTVGLEAEADGLSLDESDGTLEQTSNDQAEKQADTDLEVSPSKPAIEIEQEAEDDDEIEISLDGIEISVGESEIVEEKPGESSQPIYEDTSSIVLDEDAFDSIAGDIDGDDEKKKKDEKSGNDIDGDDSLVVNLDDLDLD